MRTRRETHNLQPSARTHARPAARPGRATAKQLLIAARPGQAAARLALNAANQIRPAALPALIAARRESAPRLPRTTHLLRAMLRRRLAALQMQNAVKQ